METIICRVGDTCRFVVTIGSGANPLDPRFDKARFQVRETLDASVLLIDVDETSGISFDYANSQVLVYLGATVTGAVGMPLPRNASAQLRLYNSTDADDRVSWLLPFEVSPSVIQDD